MEISFKHGNPQRQPTFGDVAINQFFVNRDGDLCQKNRSAGYSIIAIPSGRPWSAHRKASDNQGIERMLPNIDNINY